MDREFVEQIFNGYSDEYTYLENLLQSVSDKITRFSKNIKRVFTGEERDPLFSKRVIYVDLDIFRNDAHEELWLNTISDMFSPSSIEIYDLRHYINLSTLHNSIKTDIKNSLFPKNLYKKIDNSENNYIIILFNREHIGSKEFDSFVYDTFPIHECICLGEKEDYNLLQKAYIESIFFNIKYMKV